MRSLTTSLRLSPTHTRRPGCAVERSIFGVFARSLNLSLAWSEQSTTSNISLVAENKGSRDRYLSFRGIYKGIRRAYDSAE
ncbi:hypothetical protein KC342_g13 [Hortaea werneckii]|nr:hypothetical protein KC342_g13 [Hortaea werneckii]